MVVLVALTRCPVAPQLYWYCRALMVDVPFPTAATNLQHLLHTAVYNRNRIVRLRAKWMRYEVGGRAKYVLCCAAQTVRACGDGSVVTAVVDGVNVLRRRGLVPVVWPGHGQRRDKRTAPTRHAVGRRCVRGRLLA